jgi:hypothetical protein
MLKKFLIGTLVGVAMLVATSASAYYDFGPTTLKQGSKGEFVKTLQAFVGASPVDGSFGGMTKAKVMAWQASNGLTPDGVFGPASKAKANETSGTTAQGSCPTGYVTATPVAPLFASCVLATPAQGSCPTGYVAVAPVAPTFAACKAEGTTPTDGTLTGGAGDITLSKTSTGVESQVAEGNTENVLGFKIEATDSDAAIKNLKITLNNLAADVTAGGSYRLADYASKVEVYMGSTLVGSADTSAFTKDVHSYSKSIALTDAVVKMGTSNKATFYVKVVALSNIDTTDVDHNDWTVLVDNIRFQDATGVIMTLNDSETETFNFTDLAGTGDLKLTVSKGSGSPVAQSVQVTETSGTTDVLMLEFKLKATGSDMSFDQVALTVTGGSTTTKVADMLDSLSLKQGTGELASINTTFVSNSDADADTTGSQAYVFNLDNTFTVDQDSTETFKVYAKIKDMDSFTSGYLTITLPNDAVNAEDSNGDLLSTTENSGSVTGAAQTFYAKGISASAFTNSVTATVDAGLTIKETYKVSFKVTALGENYYVPKAWTGYTVIADGTNVVQSAGEVARSQSSLSSTATVDGDYYLISDGSTETFTTTVVLSSGSASGFFRVQLGTLKYYTDAIGSDEVTYTFAPASDYDTEAGELNAAAA